MESQYATCVYMRFSRDTTEMDKNNDRRALHGGLLLLAFPIPWLFPSTLFWPVFLLLPLGIYFLVVLLVRPLRTSLHWMQVGRFDIATVGNAVGIMIVSCLVLAGFDYFQQPNLEALGGRMPGWVLKHVSP